MTEDDHLGTFWLCHLQESKPFRSTCILKNIPPTNVWRNKIALKSLEQLTC